MNAISLDDGTQLDLDTTEGRYRYVAHFLNQHGAHPEIWSALSSLYEAAKHNEDSQFRCTVCEGTKGRRGMSCECLTWATLDVRHQFLTGHHEWCPHRPDALTAAYELIAEMARGMECWAVDEDGAIHADAWQAYRRAKALQGKFLPVDPD